MTPCSNGWSLWEWFGLGVIVVKLPNESYHSDVNIITYGISAPILICNDVVHLVFSGV